MDIQNIIVGLVTGFISGIISGVLITLYFRKRDEKERVFKYWEQYLFRQMEQCDIFIPAEALQNIAPLGGVNGRFGKALSQIQETIHPVEDAVMTDEQSAIAENVIIALDELGKWYKSSK